MKKKKKAFHKSARRLPRQLAVDRLLKAVGDWVDAFGGNALVAGGIGVIDSGIDPYTFHVAIKVTGRRPISERSEKP
jgi:hypothetical protein